MNQILFKKNADVRKIRFFKFLLFLSIVVFIALSFYELNNYYLNSIKENSSNSLLNSFNIEKLYYSVNDTNQIVLESNESNKAFIIGIIEIPKLNIKYPILSTFSDDLLKISPCRFYGPYPNNIGNLCITAHNYDDNRFFGNLKNLNIGDKVKIYDSNNFVVTYNIYNKFEIADTDLSCTSQDTNNRKEITLVTCNNFNKKRLIIKAKE